MVQKFGLPELEALTARKRRPHMPTVGAVLEIMGVPNTVAVEAQAVVQGCTGAVETAAKQVADLQANDRADEKETLAKIEALKVARANRAAATTQAIVGHDAVIETQRKEIRRIAGLAKVAQQMG